MSNAVRHTHSWPDLMARFARALGMTDERVDVLSFSADASPTIVAELLDDGQALGLTVDLEHTPQDEQLEAFLIANGIENAQDAGVYAIESTRNTLLFFRRLEDASQFAYEDMLLALQDFSNTARAAREALPNALEAAVAEPDDGSAMSNAETFRHVWSDLIVSQNIGGEPSAPEDDGSFILALEGAGYVFVRPDNPRGCVVLRMGLALLPLFNDEPPAWRALLQAHLLGQGTGGAVFAIDPDALELIAWRRVPVAGLDSYGLNDAIDSLAEVVRHYNEKLQLTAVAA